MSHYSQKSFHVFLSLPTLKMQGRQTNGMIGLSLSAVLTIFISGFVVSWSSPPSFAQSDDEGMTEDRAYALAEKFGIDVGEVDEEIKEILGLNKAEGVVVFGVIGSSPADRAGIKVKAIIKEVDGTDIRTLLELGKALEKALRTQNFSVATFEPADIDDQGVGGGMNFHFVRVAKD